MDSDTASRFVSSLVKSIQALCNGYIDFSTSIEVVGHIHLRIDHNHKFNYVLSEEVSKSVNEGSTIFSSHSYHSLPPPSAPPTKLAPTSTGGPSSRRKSSHPLPRQEETDPMPVSLPPEVPSRSKELVSDRLSESGDSSHSLSMVVFPEIDELTGSGKPHSNTSGGRTRTISHTQDTLDRRRKSETHAPRSVDSPAKRSRDEESGSVQKTEFEVIEIKEEPGLDEPSCAFSESNQLPSHQAGMGHTPDFSNCVMESLDRVGQIEGTSLLSASDGQQLHLASHQGQSDQPFPVMLHANPSVQAPGGVLTLPGPSNSQATASTTPGDMLGTRTGILPPHFMSTRQYYSKQRKYTTSSLLMAMEMVRKGVSLRMASNMCRVPFSTLRHRVINAKTYEVLPHQQQDVVESLEGRLTDNLEEKNQELGDS
ncbi:uncharacterized protein LOC112564035 isoform X23 [Pomacea canaliculata]|uniref:uncharacterized protein LOC112564035 isoform X23 n=1 Tax=Pomacea canaliculata TaxID=400727 RepID=UPI000D734403|nr:uncharacterized protein LOC112564035 isoform X23 [Pomacea canaliculata]